MRSKIALNLADFGKTFGAVYLARGSPIWIDDEDGAAETGVAGEHLGQGLAEQAPSPASAARCRIDHHGGDVDFLAIGDVGVGCGVVTAETACVQAVLRRP